VWGEGGGGGARVHSRLAWWRWCWGPHSGVLASCRACSGTCNHARRNQPRRASAHHYCKLFLPPCTSMVWSHHSSSAVQAAVQACAAPPSPRSKIQDPKGTSMSYSDTPSMAQILVLPLPDMWAQDNVAGRPWNSCSPFSYLPRASPHLGAAPPPPAAAPAPAAETGCCLLPLPRPPPPTTIRLTNSASIAQPCPPRGDPVAAPQPVTGHIAV
jgi:hypothetical protein